MRHAMKSSRWLFIICCGVCPEAWSECSDAGFCRLPTARSQPDIPSFPWQTGVMAGVAAGDSKQGLHYQTVEAMVGWMPRSGTSVALTIPWANQRGDAGSASGVGDVLIAADQTVMRNQWGDWSLALGIRLPTGADDALVGAGLGYQPGLGTTDGVIGVGWTGSGFDARAGYIASFGTNGTPGIELERGDDLALGFGYGMRFAKWQGRIGMVALNRLADSSVTDGHGGRTTVEDSAGLQTNAQLAVSWKPSSAWQLRLDAAKALQSRETNADIDGLTRSWSIRMGADYLW